MMLFAIGDFNEKMAGLGKEWVVLGGVASGRGVRGGLGGGAPGRAGWDGVELV